MQKINEDYKMKSILNVDIQKKIKKQKNKKPQKENFDLQTCFDPLYNIPDQIDHDYYFNSYSSFNIHEEMLKDKPRTLAYMNAIQNNPQLFKDKIVLDIGCGTGILSIFAARAGAKHVYAVDNAEIILKAKEISEKNNYNKQITFIKGKMEEITLPVEKVDIIISEWMGYFLLYESMLDCVLFARDKYLKEDGLIFPDKARMYISSFSDSEYCNERFDFWDDVYGVNMSVIKENVYKEVLIDHTSLEYISGNETQFKQFDLYKIQTKDLDFVSPFQFSTTRMDKVQGLCVWFDVVFSHGNNPIVLSTSPYFPQTHWKQCVFFLQNKQLEIQQDDVIEGKIAVQKSRDNQREIDVKLLIKCKDFNEAYLYKIQ